MIERFPSSLRREHIATQCVCCGSLELQKSPAILMPFVSHRALGLPPVTIDASWGLQTIPRGTAYCICNTLYCLRCGLLFLDIRFSDLEMQRYYDGYLGKEYEDLREHYEPGFRRRNQALTSQHPFVHLANAFILNHTNPARILDWGGGNGTNTPLVEPGRQVDIYDIGGGATIPGTRRVSKEQAFSSAYDLVVCRHVLEHVPYPSDVLMEIHQCMQNGTLLYIEVPHEALMTGNHEISPLQKRHWHEHINFFSIPSMERLLQACGFNVIEISSISIGNHDKLSTGSHIIQVIARQSGDQPHRN